MTKERPVLFSGAMVRAILDGRKTQTRRVLKRQPYISVSNPPHFSDVEAGDVFVCPDFAPTTSVRGSVLAECERPGVYHCMGQKQFAEKHSPYGVPGDRLWVRETHGFGGDACAPDLYYRATHPDAPIQGRWHPSIHMRREDSRLVLEITGVRVERLNDCSEADATAEGVEPVETEREEHDFSICRWCGGTRLYTAISPRGGALPDTDCLHCDTHLKRYAQLWDDINGAGAWEANPWVWVVEFMRIER